MQTIDRDRIEQIKREQRSQRIAKVELLWEKEGATKEDLPQLHGWVKGKYKGDYVYYYKKYKNTHIAPFISIKKQIDMSFDEWDKEQEQERIRHRELRQQQAERIKRYWKQLKEDEEQKLIEKQKRYEEANWFQKIFMFKE